MTLHQHVTYTVTCDRCGLDFWYTVPTGMVLTARFDTLDEVELRLREAGWIGPNERFMVGGEQDALQVCSACRAAVDAGEEA